MLAIQSPSQPSFFAQMVDKLRNKDEAELKLLYTRLFEDELSEEWKMITQDSTFETASEEDIVRAIQKKRYND